MPPVKTREPLIEETVFKGVARRWAYLVYAIRQIIIFFPCLWAGYKYARRKEERIKKSRKHGSAKSSEIQADEIGLCATDGLKWSDVEEFWDMDDEMAEALMRDVFEVNTW